jgi:dCTP deaminase
MKYGGAFPSQYLRKLTQNGFITGSTEENIRPASLDPSITVEGFRVHGAFLPYYDETVFQAIKRVGGIPLRGEKPLLERACCYVVLLREKINHFTEQTYGYGNPKSSSGRIDLHVRMLANSVSRYDVIPVGYSGELWLLLVPKTFPVVISEGLTLNQIRLFDQDTRLDERRLEMDFESNGGLLYSPEGEMVKYKGQVHSDKDGSILLSLGLNYEIPGFEAVENGEPLDLSLKNHYDPRYFFRPVSIFDHSIALKANTFYILSTKEYVRVPDHLACEMRPMDERSGDLRSHYAGYIDPGWGMGKDCTGMGRPLTLEVRSFDNGLIIRDGQPIAKVRFEKMVQRPEQHYDQMNPTYGQQFGPKLGKYFKEWK